MKTLVPVKVPDSDPPAWMLGSHYSIVKQRSEWEARRVRLNGSPYGELLRTFKTKTAARIWLLAVAKNENKFS